MEMPWWIYSADGMHLLFPSTLSAAACGHIALQVQQVQLDPELQFDREVFPIGVSLADAAIIGMTQRLKRGCLALRAQPRLKRVRVPLHLWRM
jgi:RAB6A-GEF complex partner protein 1